MTRPPKQVQNYSARYARHTRESSFIRLPAPDGHTAALPADALQMPLQGLANPPLGVADDHLHAAQAAIFQAAKDFRPRRFALAVGHAPVENLASAAYAHARRDQHCL